MNTKAKDDLIRTVLKDHPTLDLAEDVQKECAQLKAEVGLWSIYFVARSEGRKLARRPNASDPRGVIRDVALSLLSGHRSLDGAVATLEEVGQRNENDVRIPWKCEMTSTIETWALSVGQELIDLCDGSVDEAIKAVTTC